MFESVPSSQTQDIGDGGPIEDGGGDGGGYYGGGGGYYGGGGGYYGGGGSYGGGGGGYYGNYSGGYGSGGFYSDGSGYGDGTGGDSVANDGLYGAGGYDPDPPPPPPAAGGYVKGAGLQTGVSYVPQHATSPSETMSMLGSDLTVQNDVSSNAASATEIQKIETAVGILNSASGSIDQTEQDFITNINKIEYTGSSGRSGTDLTTGTFYVSQADLDNYSAGEFATDIAHDGQHVDQYTSGEFKGISYSNGVPDAGASMTAAVQLEKDATTGQLAVGNEIGVTSDISSRLSTYSADANGQIEARLGQPLTSHH